MYSMRFDMRAPSSGVPRRALYRAAIEMSTWAETRGCLAAVLCEHHGSDDGYLRLCGGLPRNSRGHTCKRQSTACA